MFISTACNVWKVTLCLAWLNVPIVQGEIFPSRNISLDLLSLVRYLKMFSYLLCNISPQNKGTDHYHFFSELIRSEFFGSCRELLSKYICYQEKKHCYKIRRVWQKIKGMIFVPQNYHCLEKDRTDFNRYLVKDQMCAKVNNNSELLESCLCVFLFPIII